MWRLVDDGVDVAALCLVDRLIEGKEIIDSLLCFCVFELTYMSASRAIDPMTLPLWLNRVCRLLEINRPALLDHVSEVLKRTVGGPIGKLLIFAGSFAEVCIMLIME